MAIGAASPASMCQCSTIRHQLMMLQMLCGGHLSTCLWLVACQTGWCRQAIGGHAKKSDAAWQLLAVRCDRCTCRFAAPNKFEAQIDMLPTEAMKAFVWATTLWKEDA
eukprot:2768263-Amphidinium_carterae.1